MARTRELFCDGDLSDHLRTLTVRMLEAVQKESETYLLSVDDEEWAGHLASSYAVEAPVLRPDAMEVIDGGEAPVDVSHEHFARHISDPSRPAYVPGRKVTVVVPFDGDQTVFLATPSTRTHNPPQAAVADGELRLNFDYPADRRPDIKAAVDKELSSVQQYLGWARAQIEQHNQTLRDQALGAISTRRQRVLADREHLDGLGIPVRQRADAPKTYAAPGVARRGPRSTTAPPAAKPAPLEPVMVDDLYNHVLSLIAVMGRAMERTPAIYRKHEEEQLRDQLLTMINTHYEGQATGETFNASGKTDILVRIEDRNIFIGECKWWSGPSGFVEAVEQLFGYSTWRDTKLALVMFVRAKGLTALVDKAVTAAEEHSSFIRWTAEHGETELRCRVRWPGDDQREADLTVVFVHLSAAS